MLNSMKCQTAKWLFEIKEPLVCAECCKLYIAPKTAPCCHSLCQGCWAGRRSCPVCSVPVNRRDLKVNSTLNSLSQNVQALCESFQDVFKDKLDDVMLDISRNNKDDMKIIPKSTPANEVVNWLENSQNNFSIAPTNSELSIQDVITTTNEVQIHCGTKKVAKHTHNKVLYVTPPQKDWDKIETFSDSKESNTKNKENIIGPMDIEPFFLNEDDSNHENPRRSARRKKDVKTINSWNNVKKMKNDLNKLKKNKKAKLNVSTEPCNINSNITKISHEHVKNLNKSKDGGDLSKPDIPEEKVVKQSITRNKQEKNMMRSEKIENFENIAETTHKTDIFLSRSSDVSDSGKSIEGKNNICKEVISKDESIVDVSCPSVPKANIRLEEENGSLKEPNSAIILTTNATLKEFQAQQKNDSKSSQGSVKNKTSNILHTHPTGQNNDENQNSGYTNINNNVPKVTFFEKSVTSDTNSINIDAAKQGTEDIEISIRVGNSVANITIKRKDNDIQLNLNKNCSVQASLGPHSISSKSNTIDQQTQVHFSVNADYNENVKTVNNEPNYLKVNADNKDTQKNVLPVKQHTASADTDTAQFEIPESIEKEMSELMEFDNRIVNKMTPNIHQESDEINNFKTAKSLSHSNVILGYMENEISNSYQNSVIDLPNIKSKNNQRVSSQILTSTFRNTDFINTKPSQKRTHHSSLESTPRDEDLPLSKKHKTRFENTDRKEDAIDKSIEGSEQIHYDQVMSQVFANIDADIENNKKSQSSSDIKALDNIKNKKLNVLLESQQKSEVNQVTQKRGETEYVDQEHSENVFSLLEKNTKDEVQEIQRNIESVRINTQQKIDNLLTPGMYAELASTQENPNQVEDIDFMENIMATPRDDDSDKSVVEETPQKSTSFSKITYKNDTKTVLDSETPDILKRQKPESIQNKSYSSLKVTSTQKFVTPCAKSLETPRSLYDFSNEIQHKSTPFARKTLDFCNTKPEERQEKDQDETLCPTSNSLIGKNTQEKEIISKAFESTPKCTKERSPNLKNLQSDRKLCIAGSCLTDTELRQLQILCGKNKWKFLENYTEELTHLVVGVDEENKAQRSVKYMCALAAGKWIINPKWLSKSYTTNFYIDESPYEVRDSTGELGPHYSRVAETRLFEGITFCCLPPFSVLDVGTMKAIVRAAGGRVVEQPREARATPERPALVLGEPDSTQESRFIYLAMQLKVVPVNFEWVLNCLGSYSLQSVRELLLCPASLLPPAAAAWPAQLTAADDSADF